MVDHGVLLAGDTFSSFLTLVFLWWFRLKVELSDEVSILAHGVLVHGARVEVLLIDGRLLGRTRSLVLSRGALGIELDVGESKEQVFTLGVLKEALRFVPGGTLELESMDPDTFSRLLNALAFNAGIISNKRVTDISHFRSRLDGIQRPVIDSVSTGDLLSYRGEETLTIEESSEPERNRSIFSQPGG